MKIKFEDLNCRHLETYMEKFLGEELLEDIKEFMDQEVYEKHGLDVEEDLLDDFHFRTMTQCALENKDFRHNTCVVSLSGQYINEGAGLKLDFPLNISLEVLDPIDLDSLEASVDIIDLDLCFGDLAITEI